MNSTMAGYFNKLVIPLLNRNSAYLLNYIFRNDYQQGLLDKLEFLSIGEVVQKIVCISDVIAEQYWD